MCHQIMCWKEKILPYIFKKFNHNFICKSVEIHISDNYGMANRVNQRKIKSSSKEYVTQLNFWPMENIFWKV